MLKGRNVLVTGGTGSIGSEIVRQVLKQEPNVVRVYSRDESKQFDLQHELASYGLTVRYLVGDVRDFERLRFAMDGIDVVFHASALKHVPSCEFNPFEAVKTNIIGTQNVIQASLDCGVERVIGVSTDKAVSPSNTMGATKLLAEKLLSSANLYKGNRRTVFSCVRFGNVMGSRGSVLPLFVDHVLQHKDLPVTDLEMKRFMMSITDAVKLVLQAGEIAEGGETFILQMPVIRVVDLAMQTIAILSEEFGLPGVSTSVVGIRRGEKLNEVLIGDEELSRAYRLNDMYVIKPEWKADSYGWENFAHRPESSWSRLYDTASAPVATPEEVAALIAPVVERILAEKGVFVPGVKDRVYVS
ncbi:UDP-N-acetylglucosamine 4,6-dehydratase family protein [Alicyclobacillus ferrooxydans]|uniref:UDP-N-acetylglucosamine 4,6-dehydratase family protein n=1 Tax=Alicyclobacillus ferrooxydans TaxID=471514 RepID=UPI0006D54437|nr:UDP-N-acetylglucosamine 4,6-dehydratase family protein [Alicyclobacillus ferrooxydans]